MTKYLLGDKNFLQRERFSNENVLDKVYSSFMKVSNKFAHLPAPPPLQKCPPISFPAVTPTTILIRPKKILSHSFNLFYHTCAKFQGHTYCQLQIIDLELKKWFFWCSPSKIEVMITSVIKMLARVTNFWSYDHIFNVI